MKAAAKLTAPLSDFSLFCWLTVLQILQLLLDWPLGERQNKKHNYINDWNEHQAAHCRTVSDLFINPKPRKDSGGKNSGYNKNNDKLGKAQ